MKPLALDLCCGKGGWTNGLLATGWDVIGVDIEDMGGYQGHLVFADVREIAKDVEAYFPALKFDLVVASPPCQEFSYRSLPFKSCKKAKAEKDPDKTIWESCYKIAIAFHAPLILENVRGAQPYMGRSKWNFGPYHLWGDLPALMPAIKPPTKGWERKGAEGKEFNSRFAFREKRGSTRKKRREFAAICAMIPLELSTWIGQVYYPKEPNHTLFLE